MRAPQWKLLAVTLVAIPFVMPPLVVAYGYLNVFLNLASRPWLVELVYAALVWVRVMPVAVFARMVLSPLLSSESRFCQDLLGGQGRVRFRLRHVEPGALEAGC